MAIVLRQLLAVCPPGFGDKPDAYGWSPLHILANNRDSHKIRSGMIGLLCAFGADVEATKGRGKTPLMCAINTAHTEAADELVLQGADVNKTDDEGVSAMNMAWHNAEMRDWVEKMGVEAGNRCTGTGRSGGFSNTVGDKPVVK